MSLMLHKGNRRCRMIAVGSADCLGYVRANVLMLVVLVLTGVCTACSRPHDAVGMSDEHLDRFLQFPFDHEIVSSEIVSLPEPGDSGVPGPTDYVALVAVVSAAQEARDGFLANTPDVSATASINPQFLRPWLSEEQKNALREAGSASTPAKDVSAHLTRPAKRALAVPVGDSELVLYVEFVSP